MTTATQTSIPTGTWATDPVHSTIGFSVKHLGIATVRGKFDEFEGRLEIGEDLSSARISGLAPARRASALARLLRRRDPPGAALRVELRRGPRRRELHDRR